MLGDTCGRVMYGGDVGRVSEGSRELQLKVTPPMVGELERQADIMRAAWWRTSSKAAKSDAALECLERGTSIVSRSETWPDDPALPSSPDIEPVHATEPLTLVVNERWLSWVEDIASQRRVSRASALRRLMLAGLIPNRRALMRREDRAAS